MTASVVPPASLHKKTAAVNKKTTSAKASSRVSKLPSSSSISTAGKIAGGALAVFGFATGAGELALAGLAAYALYNRAGNKDQEANVTAEKAFVKPGSVPNAKYEYNLPPHAWSLPTRPIDVQGGYTAENGNNTNTTTIYSSAGATGIEVHRERRGVIWFWDNGDSIGKVDEKGNITTVGKQQAIADAAAIKKGIKVAKTNTANVHDYGFQFLWNPETISSSIARNMDVTPSSADRFRTVAGAFPGQESYSFSIVLDRVNDFACIKSLDHTTVNKAAFYNNFTQTDSYTKYPSEILNYYKYSLYPVRVETLQEQIHNLARFGTMADLEYLFKAINGNGAGGSDVGNWTTLLGKKTANIGFLSPTLLAFRFGSNALEGPSFVGWITDLSINHTYFTEDMIPLRTTVTFSCAAFAGSTTDGV